MNPILNRTILLLIVIVSGCSKGTKPPPIKLAPVKIISPPLHFLSFDEQKNEMLTQIKTLRKGDRIEDVVKRIEGLGGRTGGLSTEPYEIDDIEETYGTKVTCYITNFSAANLYFSFWFGKDDRLIKITTYQGSPSRERKEIHIEGIDLQ